MAGEGRRFEDDPVLSNLAQIKLRVDSNNVMALQCVYEDGSQTSEHLDLPRDRHEIFALNKGSVSGQLRSFIPQCMLTDSFLDEAVIVSITLHQRPQAHVGY